MSTEPPIGSMFIETERAMTHRVVTSTLKQITRMLCKVDDRALVNVPATGPLILVANHINFLEVPVLYTHLMPRPITAFAKAETWNNPLLRPLFDLWDAIPLKRGEPDMQAMRSALQALKQGKILAVAPEGTRSGDGRLKRGHPGVVLLALKSGAPLLPMVYYGSERFYHNMRRFQRTSFTIKVGQPFTLEPGPEKTSAEVRQCMVDEIMYRLALLLPPDYRGEYRRLEQASEQYLRFLPPGTQGQPERVN